MLAVSEGHDFSSDSSVLIPDSWGQRILGPRSDPAYNLVTNGFVFGSLCHLWLADAWQSDWFAANLFYVIGLIVLVFWRAAIGWLFCALGLAIPLFFLRDQLSQSMFMLVIASAGFVVFAMCDRTLTGLAIDSFLRVCRGSTTAAYLLAALHKANRDFFDPAFSCAVYGLDKIEAYWQISYPIWPAEWLAWLPPVVLLLEGGIGVAYLVGRRDWAWRLAAVFHLPLTLTMAPAFAFVMLTGHLAFVDERDRRAFGETFRRHRWWLIPASLGLTYVSLWFHGAPVEWSMVPKECILWFVIGWVWLTPGRHRFALPSIQRRPVSVARLRFASTFFVVAFVCNGLSPYTGLKIQHAFAMLSNLRVDTGCWNSSLVSETFRVSDGYIRVDEVYFREPGALTEYEDIVTRGLWSPPQIRQMQRNWCSEKLRPFYLAGIYKGVDFVIADACDLEMELPFGEWAPFGVAIFGNYLRFQKNLLRRCPQKCLH